MNYKFIIYYFLLLLVIFIHALPKRGNNKLLSDCSDNPNTSVVFIIRVHGMYFNNLLSLLWNLESQSYYNGKIFAVLVSTEEKDRLSLDRFVKDRWPSHFVKKVSVKILEIPKYVYDVGIQV